ncbi:hypothetical protein EVAR_18000_1 [Eumeta japonica]|uniref:Uncharacterized protein n=1 Tax=Eumeta variegata TaxID=151549 RepID=A0A4C1Y9J9_EUMVA|nr:hypothetical protein EVAR_18000_1 [Eumeta japonica]
MLEKLSESIVSSEMLRGGGGIVASLLYQLFNNCWKSHRSDLFMLHKPEDTLVEDQQAAGSALSVRCGNGDGKLKLIGNSQ